LLRFEEQALSAPPYREMKLSGWGGTTCDEARVYRPARLRDLNDCLRQDSAGGIIARGMGRSYGDSASLAGGSVILTERLNRMLAFDIEHGLLTCEAGISFAEILAVFVPRGYFLPVTPGTKFVSVGGAIAADIHGKNHHVHGSLGNFVESLDLRTALGDELHCSRAENSDVFWATIGGMGLTGIILRATIRLIRIETNQIRADYLRLNNLRELLTRFVLEQEKSTYSVAWIDCVANGSKLGRSVLIRGEHASKDEVRRPDTDSLLNIPRQRMLTIPFALPEFVLNPYSVAAFNSVYYRTHPSRQRVLMSFEPFFYPLDKVARWNRIYGKRGFIQYQVLLPLESSSEGFSKLLGEIVNARIASFLGVMKRTGDANPGMLSFCRPGVTLALDLPNVGRPLRDLVERLDAIVVDYAGRLYFAKDSISSPETFQAMYPRLEEFRQVRARLDPNGHYVSSQARRLRIVT
jgi:decaprenylphospho-beta-D-ribofuranose 2-oxidase